MASIYLAMLSTMFIIFLYLIRLIHLYTCRSKIETIENNEMVIITIKPLYKIEWNTMVESNTQSETTTFQCAICLQDHKVDMVSFAVCGKIKHTYCPDCIRQYGNTVINNSEDETTITCPLCKTILWSSV